MELQIQTIPMIFHRASLIVQPSTSYPNSPL
jgi:hypothetical protein